LYLVHLPCFWAAREILYRSHPGAHIHNSLALAATGIGLMVLAAELSYRLLETPIREFGHRLSKRIVGGSVAPGPVGLPA
jgi:peptidoglycan/LPS O-acetylase OafA/YrhL